MSNIINQINKYFETYNNIYNLNNNIKRNLKNTIKQLYEIGSQGDKDFINKKLKQTPSSTQTKFSIKGLESRIVLARANKIGVNRTFTNNGNQNNKIIKPSIARNLKRSGLTMGLGKSVGKPALKNLVQEAERVLNFNNVENSNLNINKKIQLLNKYLTNLTKKYHRQKNLNTKLNSLSRDFNFNRNSLETHDTNFNSFKIQFLDKLRILYSYDTSILTNTEKSIYNTMNKLEDVNSFIETFIYFYIKMVKPILLKKKYYGSPATLNALRKMRTDLYKTIPNSKSYKNSNINLKINNIKKENITRYGAPSLSNFTLVPASVYNNRSVGIGYEIKRNNSSPHPLKKRVKLLEMYPSKITQKNERKKVAKGISKNRLPKNNGYITASNNNVSKKVNEDLLSLTKQQYAHNLSSYYKFIRIQNNKNNKNIVNDLSFLIWLDISHDFYKENKNSNNKQKNSYKNTIQRGDSFYTFITGSKDINEALNFSEPMKNLIKNLRYFRNINIIDNDYVFNNDRYFTNIGKILGITSKSFNHPLNKVLDQVVGNKYFVSIDSRGQKRNFSSTIENKHKYVSLTSFTDTGSYMTATGNIMYNLKKGIRDDIKKNFSPFKITLGTNLTFSYNENNNKILKLGIKNKTINVSKAKRNAAKSNNFSHKLSKTFGDLMQILDIASIDPSEKVFFYTLDQTAALIYGYIRKYVFGKNNINLILQKISPPYKIFL